MMQIKQAIKNYCDNRFIKFLLDFFVATCKLQINFIIKWSIHYRHHVYWKLVFPPSLSFLLLRQVFICCASDPRYLRTFYLRIRLVHIDKIGQKCLFYGQKWIFYLRIQYLRSKMMEHIYCK